jgi:hypothetical protein
MPMILWCALPWLAIGVTPPPLRPVTHPALPPGPGPPGAGQEPYLTATPPWKHVKFHSGVPLASPAPSDALAKCLTFGYKHNRGEPTHTFVTKNLRMCADYCRFVSSCETFVFDCLSLLCELHAEPTLPNLILAHDDPALHPALPPDEDAPGVLLVGASTACYKHGEDIPIPKVHATLDGITGEPFYLRSVAGKSELYDMCLSVGAKYSVASVASYPVRFLSWGNCRTANTWLVTSIPGMSQEFLYRIALNTKDQYKGSSKCLEWSKSEWSNTEALVLLAKCSEINKYSN